MNVSELYHYAQPVDAGTMLGDGAQKLLGSPDVELHDLLVRECAQNSWDARLGKGIPYFEIDVRTLNRSQHAVLKNIVFKDHRYAPDDPTFHSEPRGELWAIEISDRNTTGLDGSIYSRTAPQPGESTNFRNLIFAYGAARDVDYGGGTYGFGKTAAFNSSLSATLIYWTRCQHEGKLQYRLIASSIGSPFDIDGTSYTGRHWWGQNSDGQIAPLTGEAARVLGESIFKSRFQDNQTGTSILVLSPRPVQAGEREKEPKLSELMQRLAERMRDSVLEHLWPKITPDTNGTAPMDIRIQFQGSDLDYGSSDEGLWQHWKQLLNTVRDMEQTGVKNENIPGVSSNIIRYIRTPQGIDPELKIIGNLALKRFYDLGSASYFDRVHSGKKNHVCMVRAPELVVYYREYTSDIESIGYICGLFKADSSPAADNAFSAAENPTHTTWNTSTLEKMHRLPVNKAMKEVQACFNEFLADQRLSDGNSKFQSSLKLARSLDHLLALESGFQNTSTPKRRKRQNRKTLQTPTILGTQFAGLFNGYQHHVLLVESAKTLKPQRVKLIVKESSGDGDYTLKSQEFSTRWFDHRNVMVANATEVVLSPSKKYRVELRTPPERVLDISLEVVASE